MPRSLSVIGLVILVVAALAAIYLLMTPEEDRASGGMSGSSAGRDSAVPLVKGYAEGAEIIFIHTEASAPEVADILTEMMGSPVLVVPSLAEAPEAMLANVYVFTNGIAGDGPLGFQPDVFDSSPDAENYSPLRALYRVTWANTEEARTVRSAAEILEAEAGGEVTIERTGIVVNMPFVSWTGGQR